MEGHTAEVGEISESLAMLTFKEFDAQIKAQ